MPKYGAPGPSGVGSPKTGHWFLKSFDRDNPVPNKVITAPRWVLVSGDPMGGTDLKLEDSIAVSNGGVTVFGDLTAPPQPGTYTGYWALRDRAGHVVPMVGGTKDNTLYVQIVVTGP